MIDIIYACLLTTHEDDFVYYEVNDNRDWWLLLAKHYLSHSNEPINSIAQACGYKNVEHFSRQFKKQNGVSPREYRKSITQ